MYFHGNVWTQTNTIIIMYPKLRVYNYTDYITSILPQLGLPTCQKEPIEVIKQTLELQLAFEQEVLNVEQEYLKLCKLNRSLPEEYCNNERTIEEWHKDNMILWALCIIIIWTQPCDIVHIAWTICRSSSVVPENFEDMNIQKSILCVKYT